MESKKVKMPDGLVYSTLEKNVADMVARGGIVVVEPAKVEAKKPAAKRESKKSNNNKQTKF